MKIKSYKGRTKPGSLFWLLIGCFFLEYVRPQSYIPILGVIRPSLLISLILGVSFITHGNKSIFKETPVFLFLLFFIQSAMSLLYVVNHRIAFDISLLLFIYLFCNVLPLISILNNLRKLRLFIDIWLIMHIWISIHSIYHNGRGPGSFLSDENDLALTLCIILPFALLLSRHCSTTIGKYYYIAISILLISGIVITNSRGGFIGLAVIAVSITLSSKNRLRNLALLAIFTCVFYFLIPRDYRAEISSITNTADRTRSDRLFSWKMGWYMFLDNPVLGIGVANYPRRVSDYELAHEEERVSGRSHWGRQSHSLYFQLIPEYGIVGTLIYFFILASLIKRLLHITRKDDYPIGDSGCEVKLYAKAILISLIGFSISGSFISVLYYPHIWYLIGLTIAVEHISKIRPKPEILS